MTCEEAIAALQEAKNIFCATGSKGIILAKIKIKLKVLMCCDEEEVVKECSIKVTGMQNVDSGFAYSFDVSAAGTHLNMYYNYNNGATSGFVGCTENDSSISWVDVLPILLNTHPLDLTFYSSIDGCSSYCAEYIVSKYSRSVEIPEVGDPVVVEVPDGSPECTGVISYSELYANVLGATLNTTTGAVTFTPQVQGGTSYYVYAKYCDGILTGIMVIEVTKPRR